MMTKLSLKLAKTLQAGFFFQNCDPKRFKQFFSQRNSKIYTKLPKKIPQFFVETMTNFEGKISWLTSC
jgi:hypothetical protein